MLFLMCNVLKKTTTTYPSKCVILMIIQLCNNFSPDDTLESVVERQLVSVTHSVSCLFQCVSRKLYSSNIVLILGIFIGIFYRLCIKNNNKYLKLKWQACTSLMC